MSEVVLKLDEPAYLTLMSPDGTKQKRVDVFKIRRMLEEAQAQPSEEKRWSKVTSWIAEQLDLEPANVAENMALALNVKINELVDEHNDRLKKRTGSTASSPQVTPESPPTS